ncbi:MAG: hypothetical protein M0P35_00515 [Bacteroidales bacterium]|jgi:hypothetical protein|nr:hypothetical protein [Bacteroidales bacterium]
MPATPTNAIYGESPFLRLAVFDLSSPGSGSGSAISGFDDIYDFPFPSQVKCNYAGASAATSEAKYFEETVHNGNTMGIPDHSVKINVASGQEYSDAGGDANTWSFSCTVTTYTVEQREMLINCYENGIPMIASREIGRDATTGQSAGYSYIGGVISVFDESTQPGVLKIDFTIRGVLIGGSGAFPFEQGTNINESDYNNIATGANNPVAVFNAGADRVIHEINALDWASILTGKIVEKYEADGA